MQDHGQVLFESLIGSEQLEQLCSPLTVEQLAEGLEQGDVLTRKEFESVRQELDSLGGPIDTTLIADALVRTRRVSPYQLWMTINGDASKLSLGEYTVVEPLGAGGMGEVLLAVHRRMKRHVAIKFLPVHFTDDAEMVRRFEREVEVAAQLSHPNIVTAHDAGQKDDAHFLVMEFVDGFDLGGLVQSQGSLSLDDALRCSIQAGHGIAHAHSKQVIHRDIKPSNLLLDREGNVKVLDMGLARWSSNATQSSASDLSVTGAVMGTVDFMAPEQAVSAKKVDHRADIYSLGCTLHMLLHGKPVFGGETVVEKIMAHQNAEIPDLVSDDDERSQRLNHTYRQMLAKSPEDRFETMQVACKALSECLDDDSHDLRVRQPLPAKRSVDSYSLQDTKNRRPEASFISTVDLTDEKEETSKTTRQRPHFGGRGISLVAILLLVVGGGGFFGVPIVVKLLTPDGTLVVKCNVEGAIVEIDGKRMIEVTDPATNDTYQFDLPTGEYKVRALLPGGIELKSSIVNISKNGDSLFEVYREESPRAPPNVVEDKQLPQSVIDEDVDVLTVAQDGKAEYLSISAALASVGPGQTIRILDDGTYEESFELGDTDRYKGVTIEATSGATWKRSDPQQTATILFRNIQGVTLRGLTFLVQPGGSYGVALTQDCTGVRIENCSFASADRSLGHAQTFLSLEGLVFESGQTPLVVSNCRFESANLGIQVMGLVFATQLPLQTGGIVVRGCRFDNCDYSVALIGEVHDVWIVENIFHRARGSATQFQHFIGNPANIVFANNSLLDTQNGIRIWEDGYKAADVSILNNVSLGQGPDQWLVLDSGGNQFSAKGPDNGSRYAQGWRFRHNFREGKPPEDRDPISPGWIPPHETSTLAETIEVVSRDPSSSEFLRPAADSRIATGGLGSEYPDYAGAVPPIGAEQVDWELLFGRSSTPSRVPDDQGNE